MPFSGVLPCVVAVVHHVLGFTIRNIELWSVAAAAGGRRCEARNFKVGGSGGGTRREASPDLSTFLARNPTE